MKKSIKFFLFHGQRQVKSFKMRKFFASAQAKVIGKASIEGKSMFLDSQDEVDSVRALNQNGCVELPFRLSDEMIENITNYSKDLQLFDPFNRSLGDFKVSDIPAETHVANFRRRDLVNSEDILRIANDPGVLRIIQGFLGCKPTISNVNMWWSKAGKKNAKDAQLFHRDVDDIRFCKLFIYLTDVGPNDGPHTYVKGSSSTNKLTKIRRYQDSEVHDAFGQESVLHFTRPKGSCFIVDTYGFHKGTLPIENDRLLLQVQYSLNPIGIEDYTVKAKNANFDPYINRLILERK